MKPGEALEHIPTCQIDQTTKQFMGKASLTRYLTVYTNLEESIAPVYLATVLRTTYFKVSPWVP